MRTHELKIRPDYYQAIIDGRKPFEVRDNDRGYSPGDEVVLHEYKGERIIKECPYFDGCEYFEEEELESDDERINECGETRECCGEYIEENYTGRVATLKIKEIFALPSDMGNYIAFTFDILNYTASGYSYTSTRGIDE